MFIVSWAVGLLDGTRGFWGYYCGIGIATLWKFAITEFRPHPLENNGSRR
jgi:hypothetical protein